jgi:hypothetical protein
MKKSEILSLSLSLGTVVATSVAVMMPVEQAQAAITCSSVTTADAIATCSGSGGYTQENVDFKGSKGVSMGVVDQTTDFSNCAHHLNGSKSFGMTTSTTTMTIVAGTGGTATSGVGCQ